VTLLTFSGFSTIISGWPGKRFWHNWGPQGAFLELTRYRRASMSDPEEAIDRRKFLTKSAALLAGGAALARTALSYDKILGANDRISVCHIGNGSRGGELGWIVSQLKTSHNVEITTVCDLWRLNREKAVAVNAKYYGRAPRVSVFGGRA
jgi:hypothetical protein